MKQNARSDKPLTLNGHVFERVKTWELEKKTKNI